MALFASYWMAYVSKHRLSDNIQLADVMWKHIVFTAKGGFKHICDFCCSCKLYPTQYTICFVHETKKVF